MINASSLSTGPYTATLRSLGAIPMASTRATPFDPKTFLSRTGDGRTTLQCQKHQTLFTQGDEAIAVFYIVQGRVKLTVVSPQGKEAVVSILEDGDFFGEASLAGQLVCTTTTTTLDTSTIVRIDRATMNRVLRNEPTFCELFMAHLLTRNLRIQEDLVDQLFHSAEKRLARTLLLLAHGGKAGQSGQVIPKISQETLAEMIGTTRSRVSFFMNRFKKLGCITYDKFDAGLRVDRSLLNLVLVS